MGGSAFSSTLYTPRMPPDVYAHVLSEVHRKLRTLYADVETPIEAPGKVDYGDVDVLVYSPLDRNRMDQPTAASEGAAIAFLLGAETWKRARGNEELHLALPWPKEFASPSEGISSAEIQSQPTQNSSAITVASESLRQLSLFSSTAPRAAYIQLDLHICPNLRTYYLELFRCAHGDFWSIVGSMIRPYGLAFRPTGLYVRIPEVDKVDRKLALVLFTSMPEGILGFLFKDYKGWGERSRFTSLEEMCDFIRQNCRFYRPPREQVNSEDGGGDDDDNDDEKPAGQEGAPESAWQKRDRERRMKRSGFRYWFDEYIPKHSAADRETGFKGEYADMSREEVAAMVKTTYRVAEEYEEKQEVGLRQLGLKQLWNDVRAVVTTASPPMLQSETKEKGRDKETDTLAITAEESETATATAAGTGSTNTIPPPHPGPKSILRTLRRRLSFEATDKPSDQLDSMQLAYREGRFDEVKAWLLFGDNWRIVAEESRGNKGVYLREKREREERERERLRENRRMRMEDAMVFRAVIAEGEREREEEEAGLGVNRCG